MSEERKKFDVVELVDKAEKRFHTLAPAGMAFEAEKGFAIQLLTNNTYLADAAMKSPASLVQAVTNVAAIGLSLNPAEKLAYLLPRNVKVGDQWMPKIFLEPSYMGMIRLATDSGSILWIQAQIVCESDEFTDNGPGNAPTHRYTAFKERGPCVGVYSVAKTKEGDFLTCLIPIDEINGIRDRSESWKMHIKSGKTSPWLTDPGEQAKKTAIRRLFKTLPRSNMHRLALAVEMSNENEGFEPIQTSPELHEFNLDQKAFFDQLLTANNATGMALFRTTIEPSAFTALYHSFPNGEKGRYQRVVDALSTKGSEEFRRWVDALTVDPTSVGDMRAELTADEAEHVLSMCPDEVQREIRSQK